MSNGKAAGRKRAKSLAQPARGASDPRSRPWLELERLNFLTDGVYAIALTLLVLELKVPEVEGGRELLSALRAELPRIGVFGIAFSAGGIGWTFTYFAKSLLDRSNGLHTFLTLGSLMVVSFIPFTSALMGQYPDAPWGVVAYCANTGTLATFYGADLVLNGRSLIPPEVDRRLIAFLVAAAVSCVLATLLCAVVALSNPHLAVGLVAFFTASLWAMYLAIAPWIGREARHVRGAAH